MRIKVYGEREYEIEIVDDKIDESDVIAYIEKNGIPVSQRDLPFRLKQMSPTKRVVEIISPEPEPGVH